MLWNVFDDTAAKFPARRAAFAKIREALLAAGFNPTLDPGTVSSLSDIREAEARFCFSKLHQSGFLEEVKMFVCPGCSAPIPDETPPAAGDEIVCGCGAVFSEPRVVERYLLTDPGEMVPGEALVDRARIGVITALPKEASALRAMLDGIVRVKRRVGNRWRSYDVGTIPASDGGFHAVIHLLMDDMGNNVAANRATALLGSFPKLQHIVMVGIAGGVPDHRDPSKHVRLGDVVVSDRGGIVQYDFVKDDGRDPQARHRPASPSAQLMEGVGQLRLAEAEGRYPWITEILRGKDLRKAARPDPASDVLYASDGTGAIVDHPEDQDRQPNQPRVFQGPIASSNTLLKNALRRDTIRDRFGVKAVEMEGSGIADASWDQGVGFLVIRGVCDYCDTWKNDKWQEYAALAAAAYFRALLKSLPDLGE